MKKEKQNKLIVITFLIAIFFLGEWIYRKIPRYKIEEMIVNDAVCINIRKEECAIEYEGDLFLVEDFFCVPRLKQVQGKYFAEGETCYIKRKVRINF
jgi:hypothetical protein